MSNVEVRVPGSLAPSGDGALLVRDTGRGGSANREGGRRRRLLATSLLAGDLCSAVLTTAAGGALVVLLDRGAGINWIEDLKGHVGIALPLLIGTSWLLGLYKASSRSLIERFRLRASATLLFVLVGALIWAYEGRTLDLVVMPLIGIVALVLGSWIDHLVGAWFVREGTWGAPTAILGTGAPGRDFASLLLGQPAWGLRPVGFIDYGLQETKGDQGANDEGGASDLPILGTLDTWHSDGSVEVVVIPEGAELPPDVSVLHRLGVRQILMVRQLDDLASFDLGVRRFDRFVALELGGDLQRGGQRQKRAMDLALALPLAVLAAPIVGLLAIAIKIADPGPAFYRQQRVGRHGRPIEILKLRTMYQDADQRLEQVLVANPMMYEHWRRYFKVPGDPRILPHIGSFLRRSSLDELPQLWNVLRGDISLVGPRPLPAYHLSAFDAEFRELRATVPPGLTGLWQISARSRGDLGVQRAHDCFYIRNRSVLLDLYILIETVPAVIVGRGAE
mgnify:CR=1 FL=1